LYQLSSDLSNTAMR